MSTWKAIGVVAEGQPIEVNGLNPWQLQWRQVSQSPLHLPHPHYNAQTHPMHIFEVVTEGRTTVFAAGELSANVWGFYAPA
jgi:hypothetical protein